MRLQGRAASKGTVVKDYGRDTFLLASNVLLAPLLAVFGRRVGLRSDADVLDQMQKDAFRMADQGFRVISAEQYPVLWLARLGWGNRATFYRVTYEHTEPATGVPRT